MAERVNRGAMGSEVYAGWASKTGPREVNEDSWALRDYSSRRVKKFMCLIAVADGMGGHNAGDLASSTAIEMLEANIHPAKFSDALEFHRKIDGTLRDLISGINHEIHDLGIKDEKSKGMGTTLTCAVAGAGLLYVSHVGDSRAYIIRGNEVIRLTEDHSAVMELVKRGIITDDEARKHRDRNVLTRAVGPNSDVVADFITHKLVNNDVVFLCTDGLHSLVTPSEIASVVENSSDLNEACEKLTELSLSRGCSDNVTAVAWRYEASRDSIPRGLKRLMAGRLQYSQ